jgi:Carboxypeptidase regulatory-like domain
MYNNHRYKPVQLLWMLKRGFAAALAIALFALPVAGNAQETTSAIRGKITDADGNAVANAAVVVRDLRNGVDRSYTSNDEGLFLATRLLPGGPYRVTVNGTKSVDVPSISVADTYSLSVNLGAQAEIEEIITIGQQAAIAETAAGPSATFNIQQLEQSVAFSRDIQDVYAIDPRMFVDTGDGAGVGINCVGKNPRFNRVTLDGVSTSDSFGLNDNGYSTAVGMPFPYDSIEQLSVEMAPFDVTYSGFSACNINAVTKSGTNDWTAKAFYEYSNNSMRGDQVPGSDTKTKLASYDKTYYGFDVGGPIIQDKLFFFAAYEQSDEPRFLAQGYSGSGHGVDHPWVSEANWNRIADIAQSVYNYDAGGQPNDGSRATKKYIARLDWNISDRHNAAFIYSYFDGDELRGSDYGSSVLEFANHMYVKGAKSETYTLKLSSQWNDAFSTELFWSTNSMDDSQVTVGDKDFAEMRIAMPGGTVYLGADDSRQANKLSTDTDYLRLSANYLVGNNVFTAGFDSTKLDIFNIFLQQSNGGEYFFADNSGGANLPACDLLTAQERFDGVAGCLPTGIDRYELGRPTTVYYGNGGGTNNPVDAAAVFSNTLNAFYFQDEYFIDDLDLTLVGGLRYERFSSSDRPNYNANFEAVTGVRNDTGLDGLDLLMPRLGFTWGVRDDLTLRGGIGLYSGGNPNVWISNAWSNDGISNAQFSRSESGFASETGVPTYTILPGSADSVALSDQMRPGYDVPQAMVDDVLAVTPADGSIRFLAMIDPKYKQPSEWKLAFGGTWDISDDSSLDFDYLYTKANNPAYYRDLSQEIVGTTSAGTPVYNYVNGLQDDYMLTNSSESPTSSTISVVYRKSFDFGLNALVGYAWTDSQDVVPMTSSTAGSNFDNVALLDINYPKAETSNWVTPNRFTMELNYGHAFFGDNMTRFVLQGYINEGQPQSYVMQGLALEGDGFFGRHLLYIPDGPSDPNVVYGPNFDQTGFFDWIQKNHLKPGFTKRNEFYTGWTSRFDFRINQEIPLGGDFRGVLYLKIYNIGNLLNKDWGKITDAEFFSPQIVTMSSLSPTGQFNYNTFTPNSLQVVNQERSLWEARLGIDIRFGK